MQLTSAKNPLLQSIRRAAAVGRPTDDGLIVAEGPHLLDEVLGGKWHTAQVLVTPEARLRYADLFQRVDAEITEVAARAFAAISSTESSQQILALVRPPIWQWSDLAADTSVLVTPPLVIVLDGIQDPGNAGAIVRSAEAFGATGVVFLKGSVHAANGKLLRASAGSLFRLPFLEAIGATDLLGHLHSSKLKLYALDASAQMALSEANFRTGCALAVGSEGSGVSPEIVGKAELIRIPTHHVESLNAAIACSIALFAAAAQRSSALVQPDRAAP